VNARSHDEYKENIGPYVLGALPELEAELLERHLTGCESCRNEVDELQPVTAAMARSVPQVEPPASLKASLMEIVNAEAAPPRQRRSFASWFSTLQPRMAVGMALAVLALGVAVGVGVDQLANSGGPDTTTIAAKIDRSLMPSGDASLAVKGKTARLELTDAPQPPPGRVYQLWYQHGKSIERGGTFRPRGDGSYRAEVPVADTDAVMVTLERAGGAAAPTGPAIMQFSV
jgi:anti-sigma-K factor RskA